MANADSRILPRGSLIPFHLETDNDSLDRPLDTAPVLFLDTEAPTHSMMTYLSRLSCDLRGLVAHGLHSDPESEELSAHYLAALMFEHTERMQMIINVLAKRFEPESPSQAHSKDVVNRS